MTADITLENVAARIIEIDKKLLKLEKAHQKEDEFTGILKTIANSLETLNINFLAATQLAKERLEFDRLDFEFRQKVSAQIREEKQNGKAAAPPAQGPTTGIINPNILKWTPAGWGGEWAFATQKDGSPVINAQPLVEAIKRADGKVVIDGYAYSLSRDGKFLNRKTMGK